jgi:hypothetical protein
MKTTRKAMIYSAVLQRCEQNGNRTTHAQQNVCRGFFGINRFVAVLAFFLLVWLCGTPRASVYAQQNTTFPILLNHCFAVLDSVTYTSIVQSEFIKSTFAQGTVRTTIADGGSASWTGAYYFGEETYLELFRPSANLIFRTGNAGIGLGVEQIGGSASVLAALQTAAGNLGTGTVSTRLRTRRKEVNPTTTNTNTNTSVMLDTASVPWFYATDIDFKDDVHSDVMRLSLWTMEYHPDFLRTYYSKSTSPATLFPQERGITRRANLFRQYDSTRLLRNITSIRLALPPLEMKRFLAQVRTLGMVVQQDITGVPQDRLVLGNGFRIRAMPSSANRIGITEITFSLTRSVQHQIYTFGERSVLTLSGEEAVWTF